ncbi:hypothetical protein [Ileibacterium valens]|uniref:hypothetical protein n=1 Tax=Ileibacterium valens TaxID=1862668 RepID=UPI0024B990F6|nr:hypothetical protein [Ileibacterium valens]
MTPSNRNNAPHKTIKKKSQSKSLDVPKLHQRSRQCEEYTGFINPYFIDKVRDDNISENQEVFYSRTIYQSDPVEHQASSRIIRTTKKKTKKKKRHLRKGLSSLLLMGLGFGLLLGGYKLYQYKDQEGFRLEQAALHRKVDDILANWQAHQKSIDAISRPDGISESDFQKLKEKASDQSAIEMLKAIPDDLTITDVMIKQMEELPDPGNDYSKIMMNLASIPAEVVSMAIRQEEAVDFAKNYPDQVNKNPQADSSIILEEALTNYPDLKSWDERWGYLPYSTSRIADQGSLAIVLSMAASHLTNNPAYTPVYFASVLLPANNDQTSPIDSKDRSQVESQDPLMNSGEQNVSDEQNELTDHTSQLDQENSDSSSKSIAADDLSSAIQALESAGIYASKMDVNKETILDALYAGHPVLLRVNGEPFVGSNHWVLLTGARDQQIVLLDPSSIENSQTLFHPDSLAAMADEAIVIDQNQFVSPPAEQDLLQEQPEKSSEDLPEQLAEQTTQDDAQTESDTQTDIQPEISSENPSVIQPESQEEVQNPDQLPDSEPEFE